MGGVVYYSSLGHHNTVGLDVRNGNRVWSYPHGAFNPVISDGRRLYLTTDTNVLAFVPKPAAAKKKKPKQKPAQKKKQKK